MIAASTYSRKAVVFRGPDWRDWRFGFAAWRAYDCACVGGYVHVELQCGPFAVEVSIGRTWKSDAR